MIPKLTLNTKPIKVKRALISVYDKTDIIEFAKILKSLDIEILSTGGTYKLLKENGITVKSVSNYTNFPEIMDGRVKTLNPLVLGGIIGLRNEHEEDAKNHKIKWIDLVICNLYPFSNVISTKNIEYRFTRLMPFLIRILHKHILYIRKMMQSLIQTYLLKK